MVARDSRTIIQLDEHWRVESDTASWNLIYEKHSGMNPITGRPIRTDDISYHINLRYALQSYIDQTLKERGNLEISELIEVLKQAEQNVENAVSGLAKKLNASVQD